MRATEGIKTALRAGAAILYNMRLSRWSASTKNPPAVFTPITYYGNRQTTANKALNRPEDMKGLKIRVTGAGVGGVKAVIWTDAVQGSGWTWPEVYRAMAAVMAAGMTPPIALAVAAGLKPSVEKLEWMYQPGMKPGVEAEREIAATIGLTVSGATSPATAAPRTSAPHG